MNRIQAKEKCVVWRRVRECVGAERMACVKLEAGGSLREEQPRSREREAVGKRTGAKH